MSTSPQNVLLDVKTLIEPSLALLQNSLVHVSTFNTRFKDFNEKPANLGDSFMFPKPPRVTVAQGLVPNFQPIVQRWETVVCDQSSNASSEYTPQQQIFNLDKAQYDFMSLYGKSAIANLATKVDADVARNWVSGVRSGITGVLNSNSGPYRFYGDSVTPISSYQQLQKAVVSMDDFGAAFGEKRMYMPVTNVPVIIGNGLNQFIPTKNDEMLNSWMLGSFGTPKTQLYTSNVLPLHISGTASVGRPTLTVVSVDDPTGQNVTRITVSGAPNSDANAVHAGDLFEFDSKDLRFLTWTGYMPSEQPVQVRAISDAASNASGRVTLEIYPALNWAGGQDRNVTMAITTGLTLKGLNSHRAGGLLCGDAAFVAMPALPNTEPYESAQMYDSESQVGLRMYHGQIIEKGIKGLIYDEIHGSFMTPEYSERMIYPIV